MPKLRALSKPEDIAAVPGDEPIAINLAPAQPIAEPEPEIVKAEPAPEPDDDAVKVAADQLEAAKTARETSEARIAEETRRRVEAEKRASDAAQEVRQHRSAAEDAQADSLANAIAAAQQEEDAASNDIERLNEAGDFKGAKDAYRKLARASSRLVGLEEAKARFDSEADERKAKREERPIQAPVDLDAAIASDPKLLPKERSWLTEHKEVLIDPNLNQELSVAYARAIRAGHKRGTDGYFQFLDQFMGYAEPEPEAEPERQPQRTRIVAAPVSRDVPNSNGKSSSSVVELTAEEHAFAKQLEQDGYGTVAGYARNKAKLAQENHAVPDKLRKPGA
jgi:hypothetical protein